MLKERARALRKQLTLEERLIWRQLRLRQLDGCKFRRQHPIGMYIADFVCIERGVIVEVDGGQHAENVDADNARDLTLQARGYRVLRFWNNEIRNQMPAVLATIVDALRKDSPTLGLPRKRGRRNHD